MTPDPIKCLHDARRLVADIQQQLHQIYATAPSIQGNSDIEKILSRCHAEFQSVAEQLAKPALRIATIGTTGAGKSTLVNGLIGRQIAPMDASELSAGVLHLVHNPERRRLKVESVEGLCPALDQIGWDDNKMYSYVREEIFKPYHELKKNKTIPVPHIRIEGPLLPANWSNLLKLPDGVGIEIYDLPGLNSVNDQSNMKVIQDYLKQCFSLVVMDYSQTDTANRAKLLAEVKEVVDALGGKAESLLFVLNRVDQRNDTDDPLEERLAHFSKDIQRTLMLPKQPSILPISGLALFYAQCAWGHDKDPASTSDQQQALLKKFLADCAKLIRQHQNQNKEFKNWKRDIEDAEEESATIPETLMSRENLDCWLKWTYQHSGAENLWVELQERIAISFAEAVIAPLLIQPVCSLQELLKQLEDYDKTQRLDNQKAVEQQKAKLQQQFKELNGFLEQEGAEYRDTMECAIISLSEAMASCDEKKIAEALRGLFGLSENDPQSIQVENIRNLIGEIKQYLLDNVLIPVRNYFTEEQGLDELRDKLKALPAENIDVIARAAERYRARGMAGDAVVTGILVQAKKADENVLVQLEKTNGAAIALFAAMRQGFTQRALYCLQTRIGLIHALQDSLRERGLADIEQQLRGILPDETDALLLLYRRELAQIPPDELPANLFDVGEMGELPVTYIDEQTGENKVAYETGSCFKDKKYRTNPIIEGVPYVTLDLPNIEKTAELWAQGIDQASTGLWKHFGEWFARSARAQSQMFEQSASQVFDRLTSLLDQRLQQNDEEYHLRLGELGELNELCSQLKTYNDNLRLTGQTPKG